ncbi:MAG: NAD(P)/FAD-dependent oxidoreductase [Saonia sp.]
MEDKKNFEVIIVGGSYAGLSAAMTLGRSLRKVLLIDSGKPCNGQTPRSHNFITQDGVAPKEIAEKAKNQVLQYETVKYLNDLVGSVSKENNAFTIRTMSNAVFTSDKMLFATGVKDIMPEINGFAECWGISVLHCPYCHGYEVRNQNIGILANGEIAFDMCKLIQNWTNKLTLFTNGPSNLTTVQKDFIKKLNIPIIENRLTALNHTKGYLDNISFRNRKAMDIDAIFSRVDFEQHSTLPIELGCDLTDQGHITIDFSQKTSVAGVFAAGDNTTPFRTVSLAVSAGTKAGAFINMELIEEQLPEQN